jgi:hypothetical protein
VDVCFNTFRIVSPNASAHGFYQGGGSSGLNFACNLVRGSSSYAAVFSTPSHLQLKFYNLFFSDGGPAVNYGGTGIAGLAAWTAATGDASCVFADPLLEADGYGFSLDSPARNAATVLPGHEWDILANWRDIPDIGCWEYTGSQLDTPSNLSIGFDPASSEVILAWDAVPGATSYKVWFAASPDAPVWDCVVVNQASARLAAEAGPRFYRITAQN